MFDLVEMRRESEGVLLPEAQRLVRIQREIAHGFHRSGLVIAGQYFVFLRYG